MSKERELLKEIMSYVTLGDITIRTFENSTDIAETFHTAQELLAQPEQEQEPVAWVMLNRQQVYERGWRAGYEAGGGE